MRTKIIILSDTHKDTFIIDEILKNNDYDFSIHAGDYECSSDYMVKNFDYFVRGNNDFDNQVDELYFEIEGIKFYLQHGHMIGSYENLDDVNYMNDIINKLNVDVLIHGHTHKTKINKLKNNKFIVNPGSTILPRGNSEASYMVADIVDGKITFKIKFVEEIMKEKKC